MGPGDLGQVLGGLPAIRDPRVLIGTGTRDDAAVYRLDEETALVETVDVFTPVVDDPYTFGQVAAANALSDIYAMGARPILALSLIGFPVGKLPLSDMSLILKGGIDKALEAGIEVAGGHSLDDSEPKYGLFVTGLVHPARIVSNAGARPGDALVLTKPLGIGVLTHAIKHKRLGAEAQKAVIEVMCSLNRVASEVMVEVGVNACTDITGFGFLGHLNQMLLASGAAARIRVPRVPVLPGVRDLILEGVCPGGSRKNLAYYSPHLDAADEVDEVTRLVLADAQTSGGLLICVARERSARLVEGLAGAGVATVAEIGEIVSGPAGRIWLVMEE